LTPGLLSCQKASHEADRRGRRRRALEPRLGRNRIVMLAEDGLQSLGALGESPRWFADDRRGHLRRVPHLFRFDPLLMQRCSSRHYERVTGVEPA
jgi:hypothetical protein